MICCDQNGHSAVGGCCCCLVLGRRCLVHLTDLCCLLNRAHVNDYVAFAAFSLDGCDVFLNWSCRHVDVWVRSPTLRLPGLKQPYSKSCWAGSDWIHSSWADFVCSLPSGCWLPDTADSWVIHKAAVAQDQHSCLDFQGCSTLICDFSLAYSRSSSCFQRLWYWMLSFGRRDSSGCLESYLSGSEAQKLYHQQTIRLRYPATASSSIFVVVDYCCCTFAMNCPIIDLSFCWISPMFWWNSWDPSYSLWSSCSVVDIGWQAMQTATDLLDLVHSSDLSQMWHDASFELVGHRWLPNSCFDFEIL